MSLINQRKDMVLISRSFVKQVLVWVSLCTCLLTFYTTSDLATFSSTSILFMANNIISCLDKDYKGKDKIFKITTLLVKLEFVMIVSIFILSNSLVKLNLTASIFTFMMVTIKVIISLLAIGGVVVLSILSGTVDTPQDLESKRIAKGIIRSSNDVFFEKMEERKNHYKLQSRKYIANTSYKRGRKK